MKILSVFLFLAAAAAAQTPADSQQLLNEVRQLRQDLAAISTTVERTQILLFRLQLADAALSRATQRLDQAKSQVTSIQARRKSLTDQIPQLESVVNSTQDQNQKTQIPQIIANLRRELENTATQEQDAQSRQIDAETQFRAAQARHDDLEGTLDRIDKALESAATGHQ